MLLGLIKLYSQEPFPSKYEVENLAKYVKVCMQTQCTECHNNTFKKINGVVTTNHLPESPYLSLMIKYITKG